MSILDRQIKERLKNKVAWIIGGKRIGQTVAQAFAEAGTHVILSWRKTKQESLETAEKIKNLGVRCLTLQMDAASRQSVNRASAKALARFSRINILVNMSSVFFRTPFEKVTEKDWDLNYRSHVLGTFWPIQALAPSMPPGSHIVTVADRTAIGRIYKNYSAYIVTKAAVHSLTRALASELAEKGIFLNSIAPGPVLSPPEVRRKDWEKLKFGSKLKYRLSDEEAVEQFAALTLYLSTQTMSSGGVYPLDLGQNL